MFTEGLLRGRRILITGGGTGLGKGMAAKFLSLGADIFICGRRKSVCEATAAELSENLGLSPAGVRRHLDECDGCTEYLRQIGLTIDALRHADSP